MANKWTSSAASVSALAAAMDLVRTYDEVLGPLWVARTLPARASVTDDIHYTIFRVMTFIMIYGYTPTNLANHPDLLNNFAFGSSANFPGACAPPADPEQVHTAVINGNYLDSWGRLTFGESNNSNPSPKPTGTYLAPGSIATITVPASMVGKGYNIRVGAHKTDFSGKTSIKRLDHCSLSYPINSTTTKVANPLGGGIYIDVPPYISNVGVVSVQIKNAVRSPYFSAKSFHQTTLAEWQNTERNHPAPWADFQSDKVMMQVPTSWIYTLNDPVTMMADWDRSADSVNDLMGFPRDRGRETIYNQVDLLIAGIGGFTPGWPAVNNTYSPGTNYNNGYANQLSRPGAAIRTLYRIPRTGPRLPVSEAYGGKGVGRESSLRARLATRASATASTRRSANHIDGRDYVTLDTTTIAWMMCDNFPQWGRDAGGGKTICSSKGTPSSWRSRGSSVGEGWATISTRSMTDYENSVTIRHGCGQPAPAPVQQHGHRHPAALPLLGFPADQQHHAGQFHPSGEPARLPRDLRHARPLQIPGAAR